MKQKIVIKMQLNNDKHRKKAMKIASVSNGVTSVAIKGDGKDQVEVIGDGVDPVKLANSLRKKVHSNASIVLVEEVKASKEEKDKILELPFIPLQYYQNPPYYMMEPVYNSNPSICSIM